MPSTNPRFGRLITAMVTPFDSEGELDLQRTGQFVEQADCRRQRRVGRQRNHGRVPDGLLSQQDRALQGSRVRRRWQGAYNRQRGRQLHGRHRQLREGSVEAGGRCADVRRALLQQAPAGGPAQAFQRDCGGCRPSHRAVQHPRPMRHQHAGRNDARACQGMRQHRGHQGGLWRHAPESSR